MLAFRRALLVLAASLIVLVAGCDEAQRADEIRVAVVDATGANPALGCGAGTLDLLVDQDFGADVFTAADVPVDAMGNFDVPLEIASYLAVTRIQARFDLECGPRIGAIPPFVPVGAGGASIVIGAPNTCADLDRPTLSTGRTDPALVALGANFMLVGGTTRGISTDRVLPIAGVLLAARLDDISAINDEEFDPISPPLSATEAVRLGVSQLVIATADRVLRFETSPDLGDGVLPLDIADGSGAGIDSTLVDLGNEGVVVVGGTVDGAPSRSIWWIDADGRVRQTALAHARRDPAVTFVASGILVAGGQAEGAPLFEFARLRSDGAAVAGSPTEALREPILVTDVGASALFGGQRADDSVRTEITLITACPDCRLSTPPAPFDTWASPRIRPAVALAPHATWLVGGERPDGTASDAVDRIRIVSGMPTVESVGPLPTPRARAGAAPLADGIIAVFGGVSGPVDGTGTELGDMALCWPAQLDELE